MANTASNSRVSGAATTVAVLYEQAAHREALVAAVSAAGATLTAELRFSDFAAGAVDALPADVLLLNLEPLLDRKPAILEQVLAEQGRRGLVFNDAAASAQLDGPDRARWLRHLAAKISGTGRWLPPNPQLPADEAPLAANDTFEVWLLGASIGGPEAVRSFLAELSPECPAALLLAQHIGQEFVDSLAEQLNQVSALPVSLARSGMTLLPGQVLVTPVGQMMSFDAAGRVVLTDYPTPPQYSPCIDDVIAGLLERYGSRLHGIIFSGMASDGVAGASAIRESGGQLWVQDPESCVVASMVEGAMRDGLVNHTLPPAQLARQLNQRLSD